MRVRSDGSVVMPSSWTNARARVPSAEIHHKTPEDLFFHLLEDLFATIHNTREHSKLLEEGKATFLYLKMSRVVGQNKTQIPTPAKLR